MASLEKSIGQASRSPILNDSNVYKETQICNQKYKVWRQVALRLGHDRNESNYQVFLN